MAADAVGNLFYKVSADASGLERGMKKGSNAVERMKRSGTDLTRTMRRLGLAIGVTALVAFGREALRAADRLAKTSKLLGLSTERLAGLQHAAALSGLEVRQFDMGLQRMVRRMAEVAIGTGEAKDAVRKLGLDAKAIAKLDADQTFLAVADAMEKIPTQSERVRLAFKLFDSEGVRVLNLLAQGREEIERMILDAKQLGVALTKPEAKTMEVLTDAITRAKTGLRGMMNTIILGLYPVLKLLADIVVFVTKAFNALFRTTIGKGLIVLAALSTAFVTLAIIIRSVVLVVHALTWAYKALSIAKAINLVLTLALAGPLGWLALAGIAALVAGAVYGMTKAYEKVNDELAKSTALSGEATAAMEALAEAQENAAGAGRNQFAQGFFARQVFQKKPIEAMPVRGELLGGLKPELEKQTDTLDRILISTERATACLR